MFVPRKFKPTKPQKRRSWVPSTFDALAIGNFNNWPGIFALSSGYMALRLVEYVYIWLKKMTRYPVSMVRFWVNLQASIQVTRKPENVRMGKGKGTRKGMRAYVRVGTFMCRVTSVRRGILNFFFKKLQVRVPFKLSVFGSFSRLGSLGRPYCWIQQHMVQKKYITTQLEQYKGFLKKMHRPIILGYILRIFWWRYVIPYAIWSPAKTSMQRLRIKRVYLRRRKILTYAKPQGLGFLRQLRIKWRRYLTHKQKFKKPIWRKVQARWIHPIRNVRLFLLTPRLPWDILLRAKRFKRILFYLNFLSFAPHLSYVSEGMPYFWSPLTPPSNTVLPAKLVGVTHTQLRIVSLLVYWRFLVSRSVDYSSLI